LSWSDQSINAVLPAISGFVPITVQTASGLDSINIIAVGQSSSTGTVLGAGFDSYLYSVIPSTGVTTPIGPLPTEMSDIAAFNGALYGISISTPSVLYRINPNTGAGTPIGGSTGAALNALVFSPQGRLYAAGGGQLYTIDTATGVATAINQSAGSYLSSGDLEFDSGGKLYLTSASFSGFGDQLFSINLVTGQGTLIGSTGFDSVYGLAYVNGTMYGLTWLGRIIRIDLTTGAGTQVAISSPGFDGTTVFSTTTSPTLSVTGGPLTFNYQIGSAIPSAQGFSALVSSGSAGFTATSNSSWLQVSPGSGTLTTSSTALSVSVNPASLSVGAYNGTITVTANGTAGSPQTVNVTMNVTAPPLGTLPIFTAGPIPSGCSIPASTTQFSNSIEQIYAWVQFTSAQIGDVVEWDWFSPDSGEQTQTTTINFTGNGCAWANISIFGNANANKAGTWRVNYQYNGVLKSSNSFQLNGSSCTYAISPGGQAFAPAGGNATISITVNPGCSWTSSGAPTWLSFTTTSGSGNGTVSYQVSSNASSARSTTLTIAGLPFTIEQQAAFIPGLNFLGSMPHIASADTWATTFTLVNTGSASAQARLSLFGDNGNPSLLPLDFPQQSFSGTLLGSTLDRAVASNATVLIDTTGPGTQPVQVGSAQLATTGAITGFAIFRLNRSNQEAVVPLETRNASSYLLAFDNTNSVVLGVALQNIASQAANVAVVIRNDTGSQIGSGSISLPGSGHSSFVLSDQFPVTANQRGTIEFDTPLGGKISALGIRFTPPGTFTTIPVLANVTTSGGSMAHLASANGWKTTFVLVNTGTSSAQAHLKFFDDNGNSLPLPISFPQSSGSSSTASSVDRTLVAGATLIVESQGPDQIPVQVGSAQLTTDGKVSGFVVFRYTPNGQEAVVPLESRNANAYLLAFDNTGGVATGVAVNSVSAQTANVGVIIRNEAGAQIGTGAVPLAANGHSSFVLATQFPVTANIRGTIEFDTPPGGQISALGIRTPPAHTFTTLPALVK
jgi:hypothetical protein